jgi:hypothetical protein
MTAMRSTGKVPIHRQFTSRRSGASRLALFVAACLLIGIGCGPLLDRRDTGAPAGGQDPHGYGPGDAPALVELAERALYRAPGRREAHSVLSVGRVPDAIPGGLTIPPGGRILGGMERWEDDALTVAEVVLDAPGTVAETEEFLRAGMAEGGWSAPSGPLAHLSRYPGLAGGGKQVLLCRGDQEPRAQLTITPQTGRGSAVLVSVRFPGRWSGFDGCTESPPPPPPFPPRPPDGPGPWLLPTIRLPDGTTAGGLTSQYAGMGGFGDLVRTRRQDPVALEANRPAAWPCCRVQPTAMSCAATAASNRGLRWSRG